MEGMVEMGMDGGTGLAERRDEKGATWLVGSWRGGEGPPRTRCATRDESGGSSRSKQMRPTAATCQPGSKRQHSKSVGNVSRRRSEARTAKDGCDGSRVETCFPPASR